MSEKTLYVLAGFDPAAELHLTEIQSKLYEQGFTGTHTKNIPQHFTLASFPTDQETELISLLRKVSAETAPFEITFNHIGIFEGERVLFLSPAFSTRLLNLKNQFGDDPNWTPHATMLIDTPQQISKAVPILMDRFASFTGTITTLHLYEFFPTRHILSVHLQN